MKKETVEFLRKEAKLAFKCMPPAMQRRLGTYKTILKEMKQAWKNPENRISLDKVLELLTYC